MMEIAPKNIVHKLQNTEPFCVLYYCIHLSFILSCWSNLFLFYSSVHSIGATITGSCNETSPEVYLNPGDTVILNCNVTNPPAAQNFLVWNVPIGGASQLILSSGNPSASNSLFSATLISADDVAKTISSQLMFTASETLDEMKVTCSNANIPPNEDTCTLLVRSKWMKCNKYNHKLINL